MRPIRQPRPGVLHPTHQRAITEIHISPRSPDDIRALLPDLEHPAVIPRASTDLRDRLPATLEDRILPGCRVPVDVSLPCLPCRSSCVPIGHDRRGMAGRGRNVTGHGVSAVRPESPRRGPLGSQGADRAHCPGTTQRWHWYGQYADTLIQDQARLLGCLASGKPACPSLS